MSEQTALDWSWVSKPWVDPAQVSEVLRGGDSYEPLLAINSMTVPTLKVEYTVLAARREATLGPAGYEQILHVVRGEARVRLTERGSTEEFALAPDDEFFVPAGAGAMLIGADEPFLFVRARGVILDARPQEGPRGAWPDPVHLYGDEMPDGLPQINPDYPIAERRLVKATERDGYPLGHRHGGKARVTQLERGVQYPNCGARSISTVIAEFEGENEANNPHIQNFEEILFVVDGTITGAPETESTHIEAAAGDLVYAPSKMAHYQAFPEGGKTIIFWGIYLVPWCPETMDGVWGHYHPDGLLGRELAVE
jgi:uncharacterized RmlC-like cupin family protein